MRQMPGVKPQGHFNAWPEYFHTHVERVLDGVKPMLLVSDPPYGVEYDPSWRNKSGASATKRTGKVLNDDRADWREAWPTPMASDGGKPSAGNRRSADLTHASRMWSHHSQWPTPAARDAKGANSRAHVEVNGTGRRHMDQLANFAVHSLPARKITRDGSGTSDTRRPLNPAFVEALMGWPEGWTGFDFVATAWSHWLQRMRSEFLRIGSAMMDDEVST